jgi:hypothetical protein
MKFTFSFLTAAFAVLNNLQLATAEPYPNPCLAKRDAGPAGQDEGSLAYPVDIPHMNLIASLDDEEVRKTPPIRPASPSAKTN